MHRNKDTSRGRPFSPVEQNHHIQKASSKQRMQHASSVGKQDTTAVYASQKARMPRSLREGHNHRQKHLTKTIFCRTTHLYTSIQISTIRSLNHPEPEPHIRPLWLCKEPSLQMFWIYCEVDTGASCNLLPLHKTKALFRKKIKLGQPTVHLRGYNDSPIEILSSCMIFLYHGYQKHRILSELQTSKFTWP